MLPFISFPSLIFPAGAATSFQMVTGVTLADVVGNSDKSYLPAEYVLVSTLTTRSLSRARVRATIPLVPPSLSL